MVYVDTSVLVALLTPEVSTEQAAYWMASHETGSLCTSRWVTTEFAGALARKYRMNRLTAEERHAAQRSYTTLSRASLALLPIRAAHFQTAALIVERADAGIRAGDALHLAVASANGLTLATLDKGFAAGAAQLGYAAELIG